MAKWQINAPDGSAWEITAPDDATEEQVLQYAKQQSEQQNVSGYESFGRGLVQGGTLGFGDELYGAGAAALNTLTGGEGSFGDVYARERDAVRAANERARTANPWTYMGGELGGGFAIPGGLAKMGYKGVQAAGTGLGARAAATAKEGAMYGGAYGLGLGEGDAQSQALSTLGGAAGGGVIGAALPPAIALGSAAARLPQQAMRVATQPKAVAMEKQIEAMARDAGMEGLGGGNPMQDAMLRLERQRKETGAPLMLADVGGENSKNLLRSALNMPSDRAQRFAEVLNRRALTEGRRLGASLDDTLAGNKDFTKTVDDFAATRAKEATPAFRKAYIAPFNVSADDELGRFLNRGYMKRLVEKTKENVTGMSGKSADELDAIVGGGEKPLAPQEKALADQIKMTAGDVDPAEAQSIFDMYSFVKSMRNQGNPQSLSNFLKQSGGIKNQGDELSNMMGRINGRPGLVNNSGMNLDDAALLAWEKGFIKTPERPTINEFLAALDDDLRGSRVVRGADDAGLEDLKVADEMAGDLDRLGIRPDMSERVVKEALGLKPTAQRADVRAGKDQERPWELLHRVKMQINREISNLKRGNPDSVANWSIGDLTALNKEFEALIKTRNPSLGKALQQYSDKSSLIDAAEAGADEFFKLSPEEIAKKIAKLPAQEREMYRIGAVRAQIERLRKPDAARDQVKALYSSDDMGKRLKAVFPEGSPNRGRFMRAINAERKMNATRKAAQGNSTTAKQLMQAQEAGKAVQTVSDLASAVATKGLAPILRTMERGVNYASGITPRVAAEILNLQMAKGGTGTAGLSSQAIADAFARTVARNKQQQGIAEKAVPPGVLLGYELMNQGR